MKYVSAVTELLNRQDGEEVMEVSILLHDIEMGLHMNTLSEQEYTDLMADVERLKKIIELKGNLELNQMIHDAVIGVIELAKLVKF